MINISTAGIAESPAKKAALIITAGILLNAAFIYFVALPLRSSMETTERATSDMMFNNDRIRKVIGTTADQRTKVHDLNVEHETLSSEGVLTPLLNSYTMRARSIIEPFATRCGLTLDNAQELPRIPMKRSPALRTTTYARQPIEFTTSGSYTQVTAFISLVERELPMTTLSSLKIAAQTRDPEIHQVEVCFEWPVQSAINPAN